MTAGHVQNLVDLDPVQGLRIGLDAFRRLIDEGSSDPFGHGSQLAGNHRGIVSRDGVKHERRFVADLLRSLDGSLPDYLIEALQAEMNADEAGLHDFLGVFDRRLLQLWLGAGQRAILVSEADAKAVHPGIIKDGMARLIGVNADERAAGAQLLPALLALVLRSQNLETLRRVLSWLIAREVSIIPRFNHKYHLDPDCRLRISRSAGLGNVLGGGVVVGRRAVPASGRLEIEIICNDAEDLAGLRARQGRLGAVPTLTQLFLRDPVPVNYFARLPRDQLARPRLSRDRAQALRLGQHGCLEPATRPQATARLKLDFSPTPYSGGHS